MSVRDTLEIVYFITAGPGLLVAASIGLWSLKLSKHAIAMTERRARLTATADQIKYFAEHIAPKFDELEGHMKATNALFFENCEVVFEKQEISLSISENLKTEDNLTPDQMISLLPHFLTVLNSLSAWSAYFIHEVADEKLAYKTLGPDFIHTAEQCIPLIILYQKEDAHRDLINLYKVWRSRTEAEIYADMQSEVQTRLTEAKAGAKLK